jgi:hypothetical protein
MRFFLSLIFCFQLIGCYQEENESLEKEILDLKTEMFRKDSVYQSMIDVGTRNFGVIRSENDALKMIFRLKNQINIDVQDTFGLLNKGSIIFKKSGENIDLYYPKCIFRDKIEVKAYRNTMSNNKKGIHVRLDSISTQKFNELLTEISHNEINLSERDDGGYEIALQYWETMDDYKCFVKFTNGGQMFSKNKRIISFERFLLQFITENECPILISYPFVGLF